MNSFFLDASALIKRYALELGTPLLNHLFRNVPPHRYLCLMLGATEAIHALIRKRNNGAIPVPIFHTALAHLRTEVFDAGDFAKLSLANLAIERSIPFLDQYNLNATDAALLQTALEEAARLRGSGDDLVLVTADHRLETAAQAEGLMTFNPETQTQADLDALI